MPKYIGQITLMVEIETRNERMAKELLDLTCKGIDTAKLEKRDGIEAVAIRGEGPYPFEEPDDDGSSN